MRGDIAEWICNTPWVWPPVALVMVIGVYAWIREQIEEAKTGDKLRKSDQNHDSIWKD